MKKLFFTLVASFLITGMYAQTYVSITDINQPKNLTNCNDTSLYYGDTIRTIGIVTVDGGLSEVSSSSVQGGYRPFFFIVDTANGGTNAPYASLEVQGIYRNSQNAFQANTLATTLLAGDVVEITGYLNAYHNGLQLNTLDANSITILSSSAVPTPVIVPVADLNDPNRINKVTTGEKWEGSFVTLQNVTVSEVVPFSNGRISFNVVDGSGNKVNVSDRFLAQKSASHQTVNPNTPSTSGTGSFVSPVPGTFYTTLSGIIRHDGNGCTGGAGTNRGYEINPFDSTHYNIGYAPPYIESVERDPLVPNANQDVEITAKITDYDGTVDSVIIAWSTNKTAAPSSYTKTNMALAIGSTDEYEYIIPKQAIGTEIRYYIYAEDNDANPSYYPNTPVGQTEPNIQFYTIRANGLTIQDIQYTLDPSGDSPYRGETVTISGVATASQFDYDLGYVYIQQPGETEFAGISLIGSFDLGSVYRNEWIEVTGDIVENFGFTQMIVSKVVHLGQTDTIQPVAVNPSDSASQANGGWEKYESMLVKYENPTTGNKLYITDDNAGFGDYRVGIDPTLSYNQSGLVLAGRQGSNAASSLWTQLVTDTLYQNTDGAMFLQAVTTSDTMTMDAVIGLLYYGFSAYRVLPRANDDIIGLNATLSPIGTRPNNVSLSEVFNIDFTIYPNPANENITVEANHSEGFEVAIYNLSGVQVGNHISNGSKAQFNVSNLAAGAYVLKLVSSGATLSTGKLLISK